MTLGSTILADIYQSRHKLDKAIKICKQGVSILIAEEILFQKPIQYQLKNGDTQGTQITFNNCKKIFQIEGRKVSAQTKRLIAQR